MKAVKFIFAGGVAAAALLSAAPAAAQYYPGYPGYGGNPIGQVINQVFGGGYGGYGQNQQAIVNQCAGAVQARLSQSQGYGGGYGYNPYGAYGGGYSSARVLGISRVERRSSGGLTVRGVATTGMNAGYGYGYGGGYGGQAPVDLTWRCKTDYRGFVTDIDIDRAQSNYGYNYQTQPYSPYANDYSQYGYRRY